MPYYHCKCCDHEWQSDTKQLCDWCGGESFILEGETPPNDSLRESIVNINIDEIKNNFVKEVVKKLKKNMKKE